MKRLGPFDLLGNDEIATQKANLLTQIADLDEKLAILKARFPSAAAFKKPLARILINSQSGIGPLSFQRAQIRILPSDRGKGRTDRRRLVP
jgi:hypothetical protein